MFWRRGSGRPVIEYEESVLEALCFGWIDSTRKVVDDDRVMMWFAPRRPQSTWVRSNKERVARLEAEGRMQPAGRTLDKTHATRARRIDAVIEGLVPPS